MACHKCDTHRSLFILISIKCMIINAKVGFYMEIIINRKTSTYFFHYSLSLDLLHYWYRSLSVIFICKRAVCHCATLYNLIVLTCSRQCVCVWVFFSSSSFSFQKSFIFAVLVFSLKWITCFLITNAFRQLNALCAFTNNSKWDLVLDVNRN